MSGRIIIDTFCFGDINDFPIRRDDELLEEILRTMRHCIHKDYLWCLVDNIKKLQTVYSINSVVYLNFIKDIFEIIDEKFPSALEDDNIDFENPLMVKVFIITDLLFHLEGVISTGMDINNTQKIFNSHFGDIVRFIDDNRILTTRNYPFGDISWSPNWSIIYKQNSLSTKIIDIYTDNYFKYPMIKYPDNIENVLDKIYDKLLFLRENAKEYFDFLMLNSMPEFSVFVYKNYPYCEIMASYKKLVHLTDLCYLPSYIDRNNITDSELLFSILPKEFSSYILGIPVFSTSSITITQINYIAKKISTDSDSYFKDIIKRNNTILKSRLFVNKVGNNIENGSYTNNLFVEVEKYNYDDTMLIFADGFYFFFNYPEYDDIIINCKNPYNRSEIEQKYLYKFQNVTKEKNRMISRVRKRGLKVKLSDTLKENFDEVFSNISIHSRETQLFNHSELFRMLVGEIIRDDYVPL